jgi:5'-methylthioadenosine phosphorylase
MPQNQPTAKVGVIGGSGLYKMEGFAGVQEIDIDTPFGRPSDSIVVGKLEGVGVAFLPRHGRGHRIPPTDVPYRANIYALKSLGVEHIIAINAVGSLKEEIAPGHMLIPDQLIDRTRNRVSTFFRDDLVAHIAFAEPFCPVLSGILYDAAGEVGVTVHRGGTYVAMEGPAFSTKAESRLYKSWGADVIGMTALPEAKLAREAEICYAIVACPTDYDSWREVSEAISIDVILDVLKRNVENSRKIIRLAVGRIPEVRDCECTSALRLALVTDHKRIPAEKKEMLGLLIGKYVDKE